LRQCLSSIAWNAVAVAVTAANVRAKVDQQPEPYPKPGRAPEAPWKDDKIRQGRPRHENGAKQRPDPEGPGDRERKGLWVEGESEERRIQEPPDHKSDPRTGQKQDGDQTAHIPPLCGSLASRLARDDRAVKPRVAEGVEKGQPRSLWIRQVAVSDRANILLLVA